MRKIMSVELCISGTIHDMIFIYGSHKRKTQKLTHNYKFQSVTVTLYISRTVDHMIKKFGTHA